LFYNFRLTGLKFPELENMAETCPNLDIFHILKHLKLIVKLKNVFRSFLTYLKSCYRVLKILFSQISDWLTDWLPYLLMPSDKRNLIMARYSCRLHFFTVQRCFVQRRAFSPITAALMLASWFYQNSPLFSFALHSFLSYRIGDDFWCACVQHWD